MQTFLQNAVRIVVLFVSLTLATISAPAQQKGKASYYSRKANGSMTSSGRRLYNDSLVCAHRTHPFGTKLLVKNPANGKQCVVTVIDRGPHSKGRIIDLSYAAAQRLGIIAQGIAMVEVSLYDDTPFPLKSKPYEIPELDLELPAPADEYDSTPAWQKEKAAKGKTTSHNAGTEQHKASKPATTTTPHATTTSQHSIASDHKQDVTTTQHTTASDHKQDVTTHHTTPAKAEHEHTSTQKTHH